MKEYELKSKRPDNGKWWGYGAIKKNKFDKFQASFKVTPELKELVIANEGGWINFSLFEPYVKPETTDPETKMLVDKLINGDDDEIPF